MLSAERPNTTPEDGIGGGTTDDTRPGGRGTGGMRVAEMRSSCPSVPFRALPDPVCAVESCSCPATFAFASSMTSHCHLDARCASAFAVAKILQRLWSSLRTRHLAGELARAEDAWT
jgi:hypothetical protein